MKKLLAVLIILLFGTGSIINAQEFKEVEKSFKLGADGKISIDTYKGSVVIETWDKDEVSVYAKMVPDDNGFWSTNPDKQLSHVNVEFNEMPNSISIESKYRKSNSWFGSNTRAFVHYKIRMPKNARLAVKDYKSDVEISNLNSSMKFYTYKGEVKINNLAGSIDFETYKGEANIKFDRLNDRSKFETYKGEISVSLPKSSSFSIDADFGRRTDFYTNFDISKESRKRTNKNYDIKEDVNGGGSTIRFICNKGRIDLIGK